MVEDIHFEIDEDVDRSELARAMLEWERIRKELDSYEDFIKREVLKLGETETVGNVRASYSKGRREFDYEASARRELKDVEIADFTSEVPERVVPAYTMTDWRAACKDFNIELVVSKEGTPSVSIKLLNK